MSLHCTVRYALLVPVLVLLGPYMFSLVVMWRDPASSLQQRGVGVLGVVAAGAMLVELVAVFLSVYLLVRDPEYRTPASIWLTLFGLLPIAFFAFLVAVVLFGHG